MADIPVLLCTAGDHAGQRIAVPEHGLNIGRSADNELVLNEDGVSRFHVRMLFDNGSLWIQDAGSRNGVFVNGHRVTGHKALKLGDEVSVADHVFLVKLESESQLPASTSTPAPAQGNDDTTQESEADDNKPSRSWFWPFS
jgi:pSer/pThr/pTyr-binding forkhead associated (FHA) protein